MHAKISTLYRYLISFWQLGRQGWCIYVWTFYRSHRNMLLQLVWIFAYFLFGNRLWLSQFGFCGYIFICEIGKVIKSYFRSIQYLVFWIIFQTSMNASLPITAPSSPVLTVPIPMVTTPVPAMKATPETDVPVYVRHFWLLVLPVPMYIFRKYNSINVVE